MTSPCVTQHARTKAVSTLLSSPARSPHGVDNKGTSVVWLRNDLGSGISGAVVILTRTNSCERPWCGSWNRHQLLGERHAALDPDAMEFAITILLCGSSKCSSLDPVGWPLREPGEVSPADHESRREREKKPRWRARLVRRDLALNKSERQRQRAQRAHFVEENYGEDRTFGDLFSKFVWEPRQIFRTSTFFPHLLRGSAPRDFPETG